MVHIDPETLKRAPLLGIALGLGGVTVAILIARDVLKEMSVVDQKQQDVSIQQLQELPPNSPHWVRISQCRLACQDAVTEDRTFPERLIFGRVANTQIPLEGLAGTTIAKFDGATQCSPTAVTLEGILVAPGNSAWGSYAGPALARELQPTRVLMVDAAPADLWLYLLFAVVLGSASLGLSGYYGRIYLQRRSREEGLLHQSLPDA